MFNKRLALALLLLPGLAFAKPQIAVTDAYIPISPTMDAVGYFTIVSAQDDSLTGARSECCTVIELHEHSMEDNVMKMARVEKVDLPADQKVSFEPHGYHLMLIGLKASLAVGGNVPVTFTFEKAPPQTVRFGVRRR